MSQLRLRKKPGGTRRDQPLQRWRIIRLKKTPAAKIDYVPTGRAPSTEPSPSSMCRSRCATG